MKKLGVATVTVAVLAGMAGGCHRSGGSPAGAAAAGVPTITEIMQKVNKRKGGLHSDVGEALRASPVDWAAVQQATKEYAALTDFLGKNDPPKGDKASWEMLAKAYAGDAQALQAAAEK